MDVHAAFQAVMADLERRSVTKFSPYHDDDSDHSDELHPVDSRQTIFWAAPEPIPAPATRASRQSIFWRAAEPVMPAPSVLSSRSKRNEFSVPFPAFVSFPPSPVRATPSFALSEDTPFPFFPTKRTTSTSTGTTCQCECSCRSGRAYRSVGTDSEGTRVFTASTGTNTGLSHGVTIGTQTEPSDFKFAVSVGTQHSSTTSSSAGTMTGEEELEEEIPEEIEAEMVEKTIDEIARKIVAEAVFEAEVEEKVAEEVAREMVAEIIGNVLADSAAAAEAAADEEYELV